MLIRSFLCILKIGLTTEMYFEIRVAHLSGCFFTLLVDYFSPQKFLIQYNSIFWVVVLFYFLVFFCALKVIAHSYYLMCVCVCCISFIV